MLDAPTIHAERLPRLSAIVPVQRLPTRPPSVYMLVRYPKRIALIEKQVGSHDVVDCMPTQLIAAERLLRALMLKPYWKD